MRISGMVLRNVRDQIDLLADHLRQGDPDPDFIVMHAAMIVDLAGSLQAEQEYSVARENLVPYAHIHHATAHGLSGV